MTVVFIFLGYRSPCDGPGRRGTCQISYWATKIVTTVPDVIDVVILFRGSYSISLFPYFLLPLLIIGLLLIHFLLLRKQGISGFHKLNSTFSL